MACRCGDNRQMEQDETLGSNWNIIASIRQRGRTEAKFGMPLTKVFSKVLAEGIKHSFFLLTITSK